jgi:alkylation response protein AidB-like acyl-CoA dehydrogenase
MSAGAPSIDDRVKPELDPDFIGALVESVRGVMGRAWPEATRAERGDLAGLWQTAAAQGWTDLADPILISAAIAVQHELGRVAAPLPIVDIALAGSLLAARGDGESVERIASATVRPVIASGRLGSIASAGEVEAASAATHLLLIDETAGQLAWFDLAGATIVPAPGLPIPAWSKISLSTEPEWTAPLSDHPELLITRRIGFAVRAIAATARTHELAVISASHRQQFGVAIGTFQAVSHRLVNTQIALTAAQELLAHLNQLRAVGDPSWELAAEIYLEFVAERLAGLQFDAHHTLAASGYFDESEGPWLFRRAHTDLAAMSAIGGGVGVGERLLGGESLPEYDRGPSAKRIRGEVLDAFAPWLGGAPSHLHLWDDRARDILRKKNWIGVGWPEEVGGAGWPVEDVMAFSEALAYVNPPLGNILMGINSIAPIVIKVATPTLRDLVLSEVRTGDLSIALGYSEPESGSDLASLRTRADRVDGGWVINGQKAWGTCFPDSKWAIVAARTDQDATPPHAGISLFLVDTDSVGITVSPHTSLAGDVSATTFWDDVFVPEDRLVGLENQGWAALTAALAAERVLIGSSVMRAHRTFERLVAVTAGDPEVVLPRRRPDHVREIGRLAVRLQSARSLVNRAVRAITEETGSRAEAPMAKIAATEFAEDLNSSAVGLLGPTALYRYGSEGAAGNGYFEDGLRSSIMGVIVGGTGDIQRNLVARAMGLPR